MEKIKKKKKKREKKYNSAQNAVSPSRSTTSRSKFQTKIQYVTGNEKLNDCINILLVIS